MSGHSDRTRRVVVVGSLNADLTVYTERIPGPGETVHGRDFTVSPGGKSANQAVAAGKLGARVAMIGAVGRDDRGTMLLDSLRGADVDVRAVTQLEDAATGVALIIVDTAGENNIVISPGANGRLSPEDVRVHASVFDGAAVVCLCLEVSQGTVLEAARAGGRAGATVILNLSPYAEIGPELAEATDILLVNEYEAAQFLGEDRDPVLPRERSREAWLPVLGKFRAGGVPAAVVTLGSEGAMVLDGRDAGETTITHVEPTRVAAVDTTGTGDAFFGALAYGVAQGAPLVEAARLASRAAALSATRRGAQPSYVSLEELGERR